MDQGPQLGRAGAELGRTRAQVRSGVGPAVPGACSLDCAGINLPAVCALPSIGGGRGGFRGKAQPGEGRGWLGSRVTVSGPCAVLEEPQSRGSRPGPV